MKQADKERREQVEIKAAMIGWTEQALEETQVRKERGGRGGNFRTRRDAFGFF